MRTDYFILFSCVMIIMKMLTEYLIIYEKNYYS